MEAVFSGACTRPLFKKKKNWLPAGHWTCLRPLATTLVKKIMDMVNNHITDLQLLFLISNVQCTVYIFFFYHKVEYHNFYMTIHWSTVKKLKILALNSSCTIAYTLDGYKFKAHLRIEMTLCSTGMLIRSSIASMPC
jgi:hypothetical protein